MRNPKLDGLMVLDKSSGITSRAALNRLQKWFPRGTRLGHAGTLDPLATGVLVVCVGIATRLVEYIQRMDKEYVTDLFLGAVSDTEDADGNISAMAEFSRPTLDRIHVELHRFLGWIEQIPPAFSAVKVSGKRAYALAQKNEEVLLTPRPVRIDGIDVLHFDYPLLRLHIRCGKGTYIRSIARDLGQRLGCGAYVQTLRRRRIGPFTAEMATPLDLPAPTPLPLLPLEMAVSALPAMHLRPEEFFPMTRGQAVRLEKPLITETEEKTEVAVFVGSRLAAIARWDAATKLLCPEKVLRPDPILSEPEA